MLKSREGRYIYSSEHGNGLFHGQYISSLWDLVFLVDVYIFYKYHVPDGTYINGIINIVIRSSLESMPLDEGLHLFITFWNVGS